MVNILFVNNEKGCLLTEWGMLVKKRLEKNGNTQVDVVCYSDLADPAEYESQYDCLVLGGRERVWDLQEIQKDYTKEISLIKEINLPLLGICAGLQLIGLAFDASFGRMIEGVDTPQEEGFIELTVICDDPLLKGFDTSFSCYAFHGDELKNMPEGFIHIAKSDKCKIQLIRHKQKMIYGVQFHPEKYNEQNHDGKIIIENFIKMVAKKSCK